MGNNCCGPREGDTTNGFELSQNGDPKIQTSTSGFKDVIREARELEQNLTILILGLDKAGKTCILKKFSREPIDAVKPTTGFQIKTVKYDNSNLNLKEVGGAEGIRTYWTHYIDSSDGLIWVVDSTDRKRINDSKTELHKLLADSKLAGNPLIVFCNKNDQDGMSVSEISAYL